LSPATREENKGEMVHNRVRHKKVQIAASPPWVFKKKKKKRSQKKSPVGDCFLGRAETRLKRLQDTVKRKGWGTGGVKSPIPVDGRFLGKEKGGKFGMDEKKPRKGACYRPGPQGFGKVGGGKIVNCLLTAFRPV